MAGVQTATISKCINNGGAPPRPPPPARTKLPAKNKPSLLLSENENRTIFEILGRGKRTLATAVASILTPVIDHDTAHPDSWSWHSSSGVVVVCLVRDAIRKSYFIEAICLSSSTMIFSQELYNEFQYKAPKDTLLTFEGDSSVVGILFADPCEVFNWRVALDRRLEAMGNMSSGTNGATPPRVGVVPPETTHGMGGMKLELNHTSPAPGNGQGQAHPPNSSGVVSRVSQRVMVAAGLNKKGKKATKLRKEDIGTPVDVCHLQHVGYDPYQGFSCRGLDDKDLKAFFDKAGISEQELQDKRTRKIIINFIEQNSALLVEMVKGFNSPADNGIPNTPTMSTPVPPPPPPHPPISKEVPPTPPSGPVLPAAPAPQPSPTGGQRSTPVSNDRSRMLEQIRAGPKLTKVGEPPKPNGWVEPPLLEQIKSGVELKKVGEPVKSKVRGPQDPLIEALLKVLVEIREAVNPDSNSSSGSEDEGGQAVIGDDEWDP